MRPTIKQGKVWMVETGEAGNAYYPMWMAWRMLVTVPLQRRVLPIYYRFRARYAWRCSLSGLRTMWRAWLYRRHIPRLQPPEWLAIDSSWEE